MLTIVTNMDVSFAYMIYIYIYIYMYNYAQRVYNVYRHEDV